MYMPRAYLDDRKQYICGYWFKDHVATVSREGDTDVLTWARPGTGIYRVNYRILGGKNVLVVTGDVDVAAYCWSQPVTFQWLAHLDLDYFSDKCLASPVGREFRTWDPDFGMQQLRKMSADGRFSWERFVELWQANGYGEPDSLCDTWGWYQFLFDHGQELFGDDWVDVGDVGKVVSITCQAHLIGIQMAVGQLKLAEVI